MAYSNREEWPTRIERNGWPDGKRREHRCTLLSQVSSKALLWFPSSPFSSVSYQRDVVNKPANAEPRYDKSIWIQACSNTYTHARTKKVWQRSALFFQVNPCHVIVHSRSWLSTLSLLLLLCAFMWQKCAWVCVAMRYRTENISFSFPRFVLVWLFCV